jgi:hypothetical protein
VYAIKLTSLFIALALVSTTTAVAQPKSDDYGWPEHFYPPTPTLPSDFCHTYHHDSTAYGNWLGGLARLRHADGTYMVNRAQAEILAQQARAMRTYNRRLWISFRVWNRERLATELQARKDTKRQANLARRAAREAELLTLAR